jgi:hypothetical protein
MLLRKHTSHPNQRGVEMLRNLSFDEFKEFGYIDIGEMGIWHGRCI